MSPLSKNIKIDYMHQIFSDLFKFEGLFKNVLGHPEETNKHWLDHTKLLSNAHRGRKLENFTHSELAEI